MTQQFFGEDFHWGCSEAVGGFRSVKKLIDIKNMNTDGNRKPDKSSFQWSILERTGHLNSGPFQNRTNLSGFQMVG
jgi:hypothetical protein